MLCSRTASVVVTHHFFFSSFNDNGIRYNLYLLNSGILVSAKYMHMTDPEEEIHANTPLPPHPTPPHHANPPSFPTPQLNFPPNLSLYKLKRKEETGFYIH